MTGIAVGFTVESDRVPARGERIACWLERYMAEFGLGVGELAFKVKADKRDIRRLLNDRSCGPRLNDDLEAAFGWDFIEQVAAPVVGADPITARERELERQLAQVAALQARVDRDRAARAAGAAAKSGAPRGSARPSAHAPREPRAFAQRAPEPADT